MYTLTLSAPGKNALGVEVMTSIVGRLAEAGGAPVLMTGAGDAFSAGLNLREIASLSPAGMERFLEALERMVDAVFHYPGPVVALVNGHAIAGGCVLAMACDLRLAIASDTALIGLNEVPLGLRFPPKTWRLIARRLPGHLIDRVVLEGGLYSPEQALRLGLLDEIVPSVAEAMALAERFASAPLAAYAYAKSALRQGVLDVPIEEQQGFVADVLPTWTDPALKARLEARLKK